jgi:hypothetical protein
VRGVTEKRVEIKYEKIRNNTGKSIGVVKNVLIADCPGSLSSNRRLPSSTTLTNHAPRINNANDLKIEILSGSKMREEYILKNIGRIIIAANQAASINPSQYRLSFVGIKKITPCLYIRPKVIS